jgi:hypothetical protein
MKLSRDQRVIAIGGRLGAAEFFSPATALKASPRRMSN